MAALYETRGRYAEAEPLYERGLEILENALGPTHPDVAGNLDHYAALMRATGRDEEAERLGARAQAIRAHSGGQAP